MMGVEGRLQRQFLAAWLRDPLAMGAVASSSARLARQMAAQIEPTSGCVLELGAGTGAITRALLARGVAPERLTLVERDRRLAGILHRRFPGVSVLVGDAGQLRRLIRRGQEQPVAAVVSSLPLLSMSALTRLRVLAQVSALLGPEGKLVQFTYSPKPPIPARLTDALSLTGTRVARVFWNLPPAAVWVYRRRGKPLLQRSPVVTQAGVRGDTQTIPTVPQGAVASCGR